MRIWDVPPAILCRNHLLGEHRELHALWTILTEGKKGYMHHPETIRWKGKLMALYRRHDLLTLEMGKRGYKHNSSLNVNLATGKRQQNEYINTVTEQYILLKNKGCACAISTQ